jgi:GTP-dependent phosphoenolpyruvate carboxykinase
LNYFLTHEARGGSSKKLLGEKKDVKVWLGWLERQAHGDVDAIETPIGFMPRYDDLKALFETLIDKAYPKTLYDQQFSLYTWITSWPATTCRPQPTAKRKTFPGNSSMCFGNSGTV